jgi:DNA-binding GntR family transcriptional regulator
VQQRRKLSEDGRTLNQVMTETIRRDIIAGRYKPGDRLGEERLAKDYAVSRNPVREAIRRLESEGFVAVLPNHGAKVCRMSDEQARELLQVRSALEILTVRLVVQRRDLERVRALRAIVAEGQAASAAGHLQNLSELNGRFHAELAAASGNATLAGMQAQMRDKIAWIYVSELATRAPASWEEHARIVDAIEAGAEAEAGRLMECHIDNTERAYVLRHGR